MNQKLAKKLRRFAYQQTTGALYRFYEPVKVIGGKRVPIRLHPSCTRAVYQTVKRGWK